MVKELELPCDFPSISGRGFFPSALSKELLAALPGVSEHWATLVLGLVLDGSSSGKPAVQPGRGSAIFSFRGGSVAFDETEGAGNAGCDAKPAE